MKYNSTSVEVSYERDFKNKKESVEFRPREEHSDMPFEDYLELFAKAAGTMIRIAEMNGKNITGLLEKHDKWMKEVIFHSHGEDVSKLEVL